MQHLILALLAGIVKYYQTGIDRLGEERTLIWNQVNLGFTITSSFTSFMDLNKL